MWQFEPTARLTDFDRVPGLRQAWSDFINDLYLTNLSGQPNDGTLSALEELTLRGKSVADLRVINPTLQPLPTNAQPQNVHWSALPTSFDHLFTSTNQKLQFLDERQTFPGSTLVTRIQDEYCEWVVQRDASNKITRLLFTSEPPEYYRFLFSHSNASRNLLVELYREITGINSITLADLTVGTRYNPWNQFNNDFAVHMQQPNNTLGAQVNIVSRSCILRVNAAGTPITDALGLIRCGKYGDGDRQSDPRIGDAINLFARQNRYLTIENPVGLYMSSVDWNGWVTPDGTPAKDFFKVVRGTADADPNKSYIVRAEYAVPPSKGYTISDIKINGKPIQFGSQMAERIDVRVAVLVGDVATVPAPQAIVCTPDDWLENPPDGAPSPTPPLPAMAAALVAPLVAVNVAPPLLTPDDLVARGRR